METLGKPKKSYGSLLGTKLIKLVPIKLLEKWAEVATNDSTDIEKELKFIREQTEAAERLNRLNSGEKSKSSNQSTSQQPKEFAHPATVSQLVTGVRSHPTPTKHTKKKIIFLLLINKSKRVQQAMHLLQRSSSANAMRK